jgi:hypothetical protein
MLTYRNHAGLLSDDIDPAMRLSKSWEEAF